MRGFQTLKPSSKIRARKPTSLSIQIDMRRVHTNKMLEPDAMSDQHRDVRKINKELKDHE